MITEKAVIELMRDYRAKPEVAEAAYLVVEGLSSDNIVENLDVRYGTGQGYAQFKEDLEEMTGFEVDDSTGFELVMDDQGKSLNHVDAEDVGAPLAGRIRNAFLQEVEPELREKMQSNLSTVGEDEKLLAGLARSGHDANLWGLEPRDQTLWDIFTLITGRSPSDRDKTSIVQNLVDSGCVYIQHKTSFILTPALVNLEGPSGQLPKLEKQIPDGG